MKKQREEIIKEMLVQIRGVFNYYTDQTMNQDQLNKIQSVLEEVVPKSYTTVAWSEYAKMYDLSVEMQQEENR